MSIARKVEYKKMTILGQEIV
ncbi:MAG: hypothetical protein RIS63_750, partial [Bacteroidota bacterium]